MGAGNVGIYAAKAVLESEDMRLCGFIRQKEDAVEGFCNVPVASAAERLPVRPDGVIICVPSRRTEAAAKYLLSLGINTDKAKSALGRHFADTEFLCRLADLLAERRK